MKKLATFALLASLLAVSALLFAQEETKSVLKFEKGQERLYRLKWHHYYEMIHPEEGAKKMYVSKAEAGMTYKVKKVSDGGAVVGITLTDMKIEKSGDKGDDWKDGFDSKKGLEDDPGPYLKKEMELEIDKDGKILKYPDIKSDKYTELFKTVIFGDSLMHASEGLIKDTAEIPVMHDMNSAAQRFSKADTARVPFTFERKEDKSKSVIILSGKADGSKKLTLAKGLEWQLEDVAFSGKVEGKYSAKEGMWDSVTVEIEGKKQFGPDEKEMKNATVYLRWRIDIEIDSEEDTVGVMKTNFGEMVIEFYPNLAPKTVKRIKQLIKEKFYDGKIFHRVVPGFCIQGGCPEGTGRGGTGKKIVAEFTDTPYVDGSLGMARTADPNSNDCQFFITLGRVAHLDNKYTLFGKVIKGLEVAHKIEKVPTSNSRPRSTVKIISFRLKKR